MSNTASFGIRISGNSKGGVEAINLTTREVKKLKKEVGSYSASSKNASIENKKHATSTDGLATSFTRLLGPIAAVVSVSAGLQKLVSVSREFDVLNAQLITATGSSEGAATAFEAIQEFASKTPYDLQQATKAFTQLVNLGLTPSEQAMTSYGDTASAMGKDLSQLVEAVADAATGEFERLKEFGIKAKSEGDNVSLTFRGVTTTVKKNSEEIEQYLINLGENNFAGSMANRMATLDGAISNLGDSWDKLFLTISQQGSSNLMAEYVRDATAAIEELDAMIASGQLQAGIESIGDKFSGFGSDVADSLDIVDALLIEAFSKWSVDSDDLGDDISSAFVNMPENIRAFVQIMTVELAAFVDRAGAYGSEIADSLKFWDGDTFDLNSALETSNSARRDSIASILTERDAAIESYDDQARAVINLRSKYDEAIAAKKQANSGTDVLAGFAIEKPSQNQENKSDSGVKDFESVRKSLLTQEEALNESYLRRRKIILANTAENSLQQQDLITRLDSETADKRMEINAGFWDRYLLAAEENFSSLDGLAETTINNLSTGMGNALEKMVFDSESLGDSIGNLASGMARSMVNALGKMGAEWLAYKAVQMAVGKSTAASSVTAQVANAEAASILASLNAFSSTAAIPITGPAAAPVAAAAAAAATAPMVAAVASVSAAQLASFDGGGFTGYGPRSGGLDGKGGYIAMVHPQETIIDHTKGQQQQKSISYTFGDMIFPNVTSASEAEQAGGAAAREIMRAMNNAQRYA